jgi:hypothetical protein
LHLGKSAPSPAFSASTPSRRAPAPEIWRPRRQLLLLPTGEPSSLQHAAAISSLPATAPPSSRLRLPKLVAAVLEPPRDHAAVVRQPHYERAPGGRLGTVAPRRRRSGGEQQFLAPPPLMCSRERNMRELLRRSYFAMPFGTVSHETAREAAAEAVPKAP